MAKTKAAPGRAEKKKHEQTVDEYMAEWHDRRYGKGFKRLSHEQIAHIAAHLVNGGTDEAELMVLLVDELERVNGGEHGKAQLSCICITIRDAVMPYTNEFSDFAQIVADRRRAELTGRQERRERHA